VKRSNFYRYLFIEDKFLAGSVRLLQVKAMYEDCVKYGNTTFFSTALGWKTYEELPRNTDANLFEKLCTRDLLFVVRRGIPWLLRSLIRSGRVDVHLLKRETPLWLTLKARRHKMAEVVLEEGADIDAVAPGQTDSAYWRAHEEAHGDDQWVLIGKGADTRRMSEHGTPVDPKKQRYVPPIRTKCHYHDFDAWTPYPDIGHPGVRY
jgi:hypothetical protein